MRVALDWTPNTNHIGVFVAEELGFYEEAGIDLEILPYAGTFPESLLSAGEAEFGFSYQAGIAYARSTGVPVKQVFANIAKSQYAIGVRADREDISSPKDLDGKTYAGFGTPDEGPALSFVIKADGGLGEFESIALSTAAYDAIYAGQADFTYTVSTWDGIQATLIDKPLKTFAFGDYGFPDQYSSVIAAADEYLADNSDVAQRFLAATKRGYEYARDNATEAADLLLKANPDELKDEDLVRQSAEKLASEDYYEQGGLPLGTVDSAVWEAYGSFLFDNGLLTGPNGKPLTVAPNWDEYFTNEFLPGS